MAISLRTVLLNTGLPCPRFSDTWHRAFLRRHPRLSQRIAQLQSRSKSRQWTDELCLAYIELLSSLSDRGFLENPDAIWNLDESGFAFGGKYRTVYAERGDPEVLSFSVGDDRSQLSVLACGNAAETMLRPLVLYDGVLDLASRVDGTGDNFLVTTNKSGWMDNEKFTAFVVEELIPAMPLGKVSYSSFMI